MKVQKEYPTRTIVIIQDRRNGINLNSKSFTVYNSNVDEVFELVKKAIEKS
jgi:hypothetical protein